MLPLPSLGPCHLLLGTGLRARAQGSSVAVCKDVLLLLALGDLGTLTRAADNVGVAAVAEEVTLLAAVLALPILEVGALGRVVISLHLVVVAPHRALRLSVATLGRVADDTTLLALHLREAVVAGVTKVAALPARLGRADTVRVTLLVALAASDGRAMVHAVTNVGLVVVAPLGLSRLDRRSRSRLALQSIANLLTEVLEALVASSVAVSREVLAADLHLETGVGESTRERTEGQLTSSDDNANESRLGDDNGGHSFIFLK